MSIIWDRNVTHTLKPAFDIVKGKEHKKMEREEHLTDLFCNSHEPEQCQGL